MALALPKRFGIMVAAIRHGTSGRLMQPSPDEPLKAGDNLVIVSTEAAIPKLMEGV
ncbi:MAG TPA: TrkA C-terminal domain-containing protein [Desulfobacteria bacterium]|nr:TrkA C-terminal domain-containing protein [Desulfobacteria bacterium]